MINWIVRTMVMGIVVLAADHFMPQIKVDSFWIAVQAAFFIAIANSTIGAILKLFTLPITILSLGLSSLLISALMVVGVDYAMEGFAITGIFTYVKFAVLLAVSRMLLGLVFKD